jgi:formylglycine-generating enzyme required for sulfatase activity
MTNSENPRASPNSVNRLIQLLAEGRDQFTSVEIAETLWLAMQIEPAAQVEEDEVTPGSRSGLTPTLDPMIEPATFDVSPPPLVSEPRVNIASPISKVGVLPPQVLPVWLADPAMLTDSLAIIRALKPLLQKVAVGSGKRLDESATVERIARTQICLPIMKPEQEPWFDLILVVDRGSSMHIWQRLVRDVVRILRCYGAFRDVQVFDLAVNLAEPSAPDRVQLVSNPRRPGHRPSELIDQRGQRIVIVLSDCAGGYWWDGTVLPMLQEWGKIMPTVVWQMLPAWMWKRTALGRGNAVAIRNDIPGGANQQLKTRLQERGVENLGQRLAVPVVTSEVRDLARWSLMVVGDRREVVPGFLLPQQGSAVPRSRGIEDIAHDRAQKILDEGSDLTDERAFAQSLEAIARERVQRFLELASPEAQRLIMLLAAAPVITLPVVRLIRDAMLLDEVRSPLPLAEVFLSGLVLRLAGQEEQELNQVLQIESEQIESITNQQNLLQSETEIEQMGVVYQDLVQYDFAPRVRTILLEFLPEVDTIDVINSVSAAVERRWNQFSSEDFQAFLTNPNVEAPETLAGLRSFASVTAEILGQLGSDYADFAQQLRHGAGELQPEKSSSEEEFVFEDLEYEVAKLTNFPALQPCEYESAAIAAILDRFEFETATLERVARQSEGRQKSKGRQKQNIPQKLNIQNIQRRRSVAWGYAELISDESGEAVGLEMLLIPGGSFMMGAPESEPESPDVERPQHEVTLESFYLGRYAVTQAQWREVANYPVIERELDPDLSNFKGDNRPVEQVSWDDAQEFCRRLSARTGKEYRLPSEAQWEYACRSGTTTPFYFGETITPELVNYNGTDTYNDGLEGEYRRKTTDVGTFPANEWGLYDLHGNVYEWCEDDWHGSYEGAPIDGSAWVENGQRSAGKLLRGGSWYSVPWNCRSIFRAMIVTPISVFGFVACRRGSLLSALALKLLALGFFSPFVFAEGDQIFYE